MNRRFFLLPVLLAAPLLWLGCDTPTEDDPRRQTFDFKLTNLEGDTLQLSQYQGDVILLQFFLTSCTACQGEVQELNALHQEYAAEGLTILAVSVNGADTAAVRSFRQLYKPDYPLLLDKDGRVSTVYGVYDRNVIPMGFLIDREGWTVAEFVGGFTKEDIEPIISAYL